MFNFNTGTASSIDPDKERAAPPQPTVVYFPSNDIKFQQDRAWLQHVPNLCKQYSAISKPTEIKLDSLSRLNLSFENDVSPEAFVPSANEGTTPHLPPKSWLSDGASSRSLFSHGSSAGMLSNGQKAPTQDMFAKYAQELSCTTDDGLRSIGRRKPRSGHHAPKFDHFRRFWTHLEMVSQYWDTAHDHYYEDAEARRNSAANASKTAHSSLSNASHFPDSSMASHPKRYKGFRVSTGSRMPETVRIDLARAFVDAISSLFGCNMTNPKRVPQLELGNLLVPVTQTAIVWRLPQDKAYLKQGFVEGPVVGLQCRAETAFIKDPHAAVIDIAREIAGLLLLAEERAREGKTKTIPGEGKWYTTKPRWGGGPGGEFGEAEGNKDTKPLPHSSHHFSAARRHSTGSIPMASRKMSEEDIWRQLKPGNGLWEPRTTYLAVGKDRSTPYDNVFMVSCIYHHISVLKLVVHPLYTDFLVTGKAPRGHPDASWYAPKVYRTKWYDLLLAEDRVDAMRVLWGVLSYSMRHDGSGRIPMGRQNSEISHGFSFRKKASVSHASAPRANSVNF